MSVSTLDPASQSEGSSASDSGPESSGPGGSGHLAENVMHFARVLRDAGLPVGPGKVLDAVQAIEVAGVERRDDFYWTLASVFIDKREQFHVFDQAFHIFWKDPQLLERIMQMLMPAVYGRGPEQEKPQANNRVAEAMQTGLQKKNDIPEQAPEKVELDATLTFSSREVLQQADFETMTNDELAQAKRIIANLRLPIPEVLTRRMQPDANGRRIDLRATLRASFRDGGRSIPLKRRSLRREHPPLVVLCDISGSMNRYSRMFLHFLHALTNDRDRVHTFVFGTRLTNVTRCFKHRAGMPVLGILGKMGNTRMNGGINALLDSWIRKVGPEQAQGGRYWSNYTWHGDQNPAHPWWSGAQGSDIDLSDMRFSKLNTSWGKNFVENKMPEAHWKLECIERGAHVVVITPEYNPTAYRADYWMPLRPESDGALFIGAMKIIVDENMHDIDFLKSFTDAPILVRTDTLQYLDPRDVVKDYAAPYILTITKNKRHDLVALEDDTVCYCIHGIRDGAGVEDIIDPDSYTDAEKFDLIAKYPFDN